MGQRVHRRHVSPSEQAIGTQYDNGRLLTCVIAVYNLVNFYTHEADCQLIESVRCGEGNPPEADESAESAQGG